MNRKHLIGPVNGTDTALTITERALSSSQSQDEPSLASTMSTVDHSTAYTSDGQSASWSIKGDFTGMLDELYQAVAKATEIPERYLHPSDHPQLSMCGNT